FVIASITDLKPDYAESSAQTLLVISQMLSAQASPQNASSVTPGSSGTSSFSPSSTAILVNLLWMLSLSLSVAVSLIAMLAKDWCYKFTSNRSGPAYDQARRRQRKWNGIEKWKMNEVLTYLPGMLHLALRLCLYLWDINIAVAIPVVIVTGSATLVYTVATILPYVDHSCPYSTPASGIFTVLNKIMIFSLTVLEYFFNWIIIPVIKLALAIINFLPSLLDLMIKKLENWGKDVLELIATSICYCGIGLPALPVLFAVVIPPFIFYLILRLLRAPVTLVRTPSIHAWKLSRKLFLHLVGLLRSLFSFLCEIILDAEFGDTYGSKEKVPMDSLTSQMFAWLISNCEDSRSVDTTLQAIAGADHNLPYQPLKDCEVFSRVSTRLDAYVEWDNNSKKYTAKDPSQLLIALRYCRTYSTLTFGDAHQASVDGQSDYYRKSLKIRPSSDLIRIHSIYTEYVASSLATLWIKAHCPWVSLLEQAQTKGVDSDVIAMAAAVAMPFSDWNWESRTDRLGIAPETAFSILAKHFQSDCTLLSTLSLIALSEFVPHYLLRAWSRGEQGDSQYPQHLLPIMLAQLFLTYHATEPEVARSSAVTLAATAFATNYYHGGEKPQKTPNNRKTRAAQVLQYYQAKPPDNDTVLSLFTFGFYGLLPHLKFDLIDSHLPGLASYLDKVLRLGFPRFNLKYGQMHLHNIPTGYPLEHYTLKPALEHLASFVTDEPKNTHQIATAFRFSPLLINTADDKVPRVYCHAIIALCRAKHSVLQQLCMTIIDQQPILAADPRALIHSGDSEKGAEEGAEEGAEKGAEKGAEMDAEMDAAKDTRNLLGQLCGALMANDTSVLPFAILHFELLVARVISAETPPLEERRSALRPLLSSHDEFTKLEGSSPLSLANLFSYLEKGKGKGQERTRNSMLDIMQHVADFCAHGLSWDKSLEEVRAGLVELKKAYKPSVAKVKRLNTGDVASPSPSIRDGALDQEASASLHGITPADLPVRKGVTTPTDSN
ncbi:hypothetical protein FRC06_003877, partial [Ceratobasidium sp. 370]